jgi:hypothetical protein
MVLAKYKVIAKGLVHNGQPLAIGDTIELSMEGAKVRADKVELIVEPVEKPIPEKVAAVIKPKAKPKGKPKATRKRNFK